VTAVELRHLRYFVAVAEERSFTGAAERLWIAQPGLSTQIKRLEAELGIQLFERHSRGVDLTSAGELFLERARVALAAAETAGATGRDTQAGVIGSLRIGIASGARWSPTAALRTASAASGQRSSSPSSRATAERCGASCATGGSTRWWRRPVTPRPT
jgi:DNA-binding transcriptional LysR family regulator